MRIFGKLKYNSSEQIDNGLVNDCSSSSILQLPEELQRKVLGQKNGSGRKEKKIIKVQVPTFPPTDIMYAVDKTNKGE